VRLRLSRVEAEVDGAVHGAELRHSGATAGPLAVEVVDAGGRGYRWAVANRGDRPVAVRSVALVFAVDGVRAPLRLLRHGYQSWSPTDLAVLGVDRDPSTRARLPFVQGVYHADPRTVTRNGELRSEWFTLVVDAGGEPAFAGFGAGTGHDGTFRLRPAAGGGPPELAAEAYLGGAHLAPGERRPLHELRVVPAGTAPPADLLAAWAGEAGAAAGARTAAPYAVGWCSWYQYFDRVTGADIAANLARAGEWPFDVFQIDDGYQAAIGDWLDTNDRFPAGLAAHADAIAAAGLRPGLWLAPFLAAPDSAVARDHPDWIARTPDGAKPLFAWCNPAWGGGRDGFVLALDTTHPEVLAHLEDLARALVATGFDYLKLDFTFSPAVDGRWHDPSRTPAERVRAGLEAIRRGAGEGAFLLGCGVPLAPAVGVVDGCRIGQDVAPTWALDPGDEVVPGYLAVQPATLHAYGNTVARSFMHRRLWVNDPDCLMLRPTDTRLTHAAAAGWAAVVGATGGLAVVSDDLARLGPPESALLARTLAAGRAADAAARAGRPATAPDLLDRTPPTVIAGAAGRLVVDPATGAATPG